MLTLLPLRLSLSRTFLQVSPASLCCRYQPTQCFVSAFSWSVFSPLTLTGPGRLLPTLILLLKSFSSLLSPNAAQGIY